MNAHTSPEQGRQTVIDNKFPLSWLIGCSAAIVFSMGGFAFQVNTLANSVQKIEAKTDARDEKNNLLQQMVLVGQGKTEIQADKISRNSSDIADLRRDVEEMKRKQTWAPK